MVQRVEAETAAVKLQVVYRQLGARSGPASGAFTIKAPKADLGRVRLVPDLAGPALALDSASVTLRKDRPVRVRFTLDGIQAPGTFLSRVRVKHATRDTTLAEFAVEVAVTSTPLVEQPAGVSSTFFVVRDPLGWAGSLFPGNLRGDTRTLWLDNKTAGGLFLTETPVPLLRAEPTGETFSDAVKLLSPREGAAGVGSRLPVELRIDPERLAPGTYAGEVPLPFTGSTPPHRVATFTLNVRAGWPLAFLLILAGVVVGRVAQLFNLPLARMQEDLLRRLFYLREQAAAFTDERVRSYFGAEFNDIRRMIELASAETERAGIEERLGKISSSILLLRSLADVRRQIEASNRPDAAVLLRQVEGIVDLTLQKDLMNATAQLEVLRGAVTARPDMAASARRRANLTAALDRSFLSYTAASTQRNRANRPGRFFSFRLCSAEWRYRYLRPAFALAVIVVLATIGFYTLYVNDPVFGAQGLYDYGKCFLWGLGTDVATKTLQALSLPRLAPAGG